MSTTTAAPVSGFGGASGPSRSADEIGRTPLGARPIPELAEANQATAPESAERVLDNGLRVVAVRKPGTPIIEARLRIPFGGGAQPARRHSARAELMAAGLLLGTGSRNRQQVDGDLALVGGSLDASVDSHRLMVAGSVLSTGLPVLLDVLADTLTDAAFRPVDVRVEQARLHEHLLISLSQPGTVAGRLLQHRRFGNHRAAWDMPLVEDLDQVTPAAVRAMFRREVVPRGSTLVLVGDLDIAATLDQVARALEPWTSEASAAVLTTPPQIAAGPIGVHHRPGAVQSQVRLSASAVGRSEEGYAAQQVANLIYGGYFSSRLVENIREDKGYTYGASSSTSFWPGRAAITVAFDTNTESTAAAVWEAQYELGRMALIGPTQTEVDSARNYALGTLAAALATQAGYASMISNLMAYGLGTEWLTGYRHAVAAVTVEEVHAMARRVLAPAGFMGVIVGDLDVVGPSLAGILPTEPYDPHYGSSRSR